MNSRVLKNATWIIVCKIIQSALGLMIGMFTARYLGPSNYGIVNYAASIVAFLTPIMQLGFRNTLVQEIVNKPEKEGTIVGTSLVLSFASSLCCVLGVGLFVGIVNYGENEIIIVCLLYSLSLIFQAFEMIQYWYQAKLLSKYISVVSIVAYLTVSIYKIFLLVSGKSIYWFAVSQALDFFVISVLLVVIYRRIGKQKLSFSFDVGKKMLSVSKHYILSAVMVATFNHIGSIVLKLFMDETAVGFFSASANCVNITGFIFNAIIDSARPSILAVREQNINAYKSRLVKLYSIIIAGTIIQSVIISLFSNIIINALYGTEYLPSAQLLRVMCWMAVFSYLGTIRNIWILGEGKQKCLWIVNLLGAIFNILINIILITAMGAVGAAISAVATQVFTNVVLSFLIPSIRESSQLMLKGVNPKYVFLLLKKIFYSVREHFKNVC